MTDISQFLDVTGEVVAAGDYLYLPRTLSIYDATLEPALVISVLRFGKIRVVKTNNRMAEIDVSDTIRVEPDAVPEGVQAELQKLADVLK